MTARYRSVVAVSRSRIARSVVGQLESPGPLGLPHAPEATEATQATEATEATEATQATQATHRRGEEVVSLVFALADGMRVHFETSVAEFDLSAPQAKALRFLAAVGSASMREVAASLQCDASNLTGIVDRLEQRGLVERRPAPGDRRVKTLVLTRNGRDVAQRLWDRVVEGAPPVTVLGDAEQQMLLVALQRLYEGNRLGCWCPHGPARSGGRA